MQTATPPQPQFSGRRHEPAVDHQLRIRRAQAGGWRTVDPYDYVIEPNDSVLVSPQAIPSCTETERELLNVLADQNISDPVLLAILLKNREEEEALQILEDAGIGTAAKLKVRLGLDVEDQLERIERQRDEAHDAALGPEGEE